MSLLCCDYCFCGKKGCVLCSSASVGIRTEMELCPLPLVLNNTCLGSGVGRGEWEEVVRGSGMTMGSVPRVPHTQTSCSMGDLTQASAPSCALDVISTLQIKPSRIRKGECLTQSSCVLGCERGSLWVQRSCSFSEASVIHKGEDCTDGETCARSSKLSEPHFLFSFTEGRAWT